MCCSSWGCRVGHDWATEWNWTESDSWEAFLKSWFRDREELWLTTNPWNPAPIPTPGPPTLRAEASSGKDCASEVREPLGIQHSQVWLTKGKTFSGKRKVWDRMSQEIYWYFLTLTESYRINKTEVAKQKKKKRKILRLRKNHGETKYLLGWLQEY